MGFQGLLKQISDALVDSGYLSYPKQLDLKASPGLRVPIITALTDLSTEIRQQNDSAQSGKDSDASLSLNRLTIVVTATSREADRVAESLITLNPKAQVVTLPAWETLPHERLSPSAEIIGQRYFAIAKLLNWQLHPDSSFFLVASARAALQPVSDALFAPAINIVTGSTQLAIQALISKLVEYGYSRVDLVSRRGEFAIRGGIVDVFAPTEPHPVRIDYFGDEVDELKFFSVADQRSLPDGLERLKLFPVRELQLTTQVRKKAAEYLTLYPQLAELLTKISNGISVEGMESLSFLFEKPQPLTARLQAEANVAIIEPERVAARVKSLADTDKEFYAAAWDLSADTTVPAPISVSGKSFITLQEFTENNVAQTWLIRDFSVIPDAELADAESADAELPDEDTSDGSISIQDKPLPSWHGNFDGGFEYIKTKLSNAYAVVLTLASSGMVSRSIELLTSHGITAERADALSLTPKAGLVTILQAELDSGFELPKQKLVLITEADLFGRVAAYGQPKAKLSTRRRSAAVDPLQLAVGDYVVHQTHGIGRFLELTKRKVKIGGHNPQIIDREYLVLQYSARKKGQPGDKLYVPTDQLDQLSRYVGGEAPALSKLGGSDWAATKSRARKAVRELAVDLVKLYSARMASRGYAFSADSPWQREMEDAFAFVETADQLAAVEEIKQDMEKNIPMDRLLLGDVGYGKTEVAVRATFKAVQDGKQVALLVPTTLLVKQHFETFQDRFSGFPVTVKPLSRFQSDKEAKQTIADLASGAVDVVIGTHRILSNQVTFKDLGLVIIDEEQRFGVEHKEKLKSIRQNVDLLSMSATPIPRTLEMAITGIREMSQLSTAPEDRHPILTFVGPRNEGQIAAAIRRELLREGQVFFVHNRVSSIGRVAAQLAELVPEARIAVAHGKLSEAQLERVIVDFWERKYDVLVATTIIETGLDIPNANTLIIDQADKYGLSQLHQIRGRVGRGRERAYAYFLYDVDKQLNETAYDRLSTIAANNDLGAGMQVAMKDLELRGAGDLLGAEQSGHIAGVGFDLYLRMVGEAVNTFRGEEVQEQSEFRLELPVRAYLPEDYLDSERLRLEAYQKISAASGVSDTSKLIEVRQELIDRYGQIPEQVENLFALAQLKQLATATGLTEIITLGGNQVRFAGVALPESKQVRLSRVYPGAKYNKATEAASLVLPDGAAQFPSEAALIEYVATFIRTIYA